MSFFEGGDINQQDVKWCFPLCRINNPKPGGCTLGRCWSFMRCRCFFNRKKALRKLGGDAWRLRVVAGALWVPNLVRCLRGVVLVSRSKNRVLKKKNAAVFTMWCVVIFFSGKKTTASSFLVQVVFVLNQVCCIWEMQTVGMKSSTADFPCDSLLFPIYIYMVTPPPHDPPTSILYGNYQCFMHIFFLPEKWHSHVSISFTYYVSCRPRHTHTCNFVFVYFFVISWGFGQTPKKHWENQKNQKKQNCKTHVGTSWWVRVCNFVFFGFFGFLEVFNTFGQKPKKHWEHQKNQKNQNCKTHVGTSWWVRVCNFVFFVFFGFLEVFNTFGQKPQKHWENPKNQKKQNCKTHVGTSWWVRVCNFVFFVFFWFLEVFNTFSQKPKKHWENP